jgi:prepilin-type N-terminal cleavage/methylation domain-containing protein
MAKRSDPSRGFTLVEVIVAITVLNVMVAIFCRAALTHGRVVAGLEEWCTDAPVFYADPQPSPLARALGWPADLPIAPPAPRWRDRVAGDYTIEVISVTRDLAGMTTAARVRQLPGGAP